MPQQPQIEHGVGSGIIISPDGYIVTNNHVVDGATSIKVTLNDRRILNAKVIGVDKLTDLAVIKVNATNCPASPGATQPSCSPARLCWPSAAPSATSSFRSRAES
jgi:serine protease Do